MSTELQPQTPMQSGTRSGLILLVRIALIFLVIPMLIALAAGYLF